MVNIYLVLCLAFIICVIFFLLLPKLKLLNNKQKVRYNNKSYKKLLILISLFLIGCITANIIFGLIFVLIYLYVYYMIGNYKKKKIISQINRQLLETIRIFKNIILSGQSIVQSIETVSYQIQDPLASQFKEISNKVKLGISLEQALNESSKQISSQQYKLFIDSIIIAHSTGAKLSDILNKIEFSIEQRISIYSKVQTLTSQGKLSGIIISIVPFFIVGFVYLVDPQMMLPLFNTIIGNIVMLVAVVMILVGSFLMNKISEVEL